MTRFDERRGPEVDGADVSEYPDGGDQCRAKETDDNDLQMSSIIGVVDGVVHCSLPLSLGPGTTVIGAVVNEA